MGAVLYLDRQQKGDDLDGLLATVDIVPNEEKVEMLGRVADEFERAQQICVLAMYVANYV